MKNLSIKSRSIQITKTCCTLQQQKYLINNRSDSRKPCLYTISKYCIKKAVRIDKLIYSAVAQIISKNKPEPLYTVFDIKKDTLVYSRLEINKITLDTSNKQVLEEIYKVYSRDTAATRIRENPGKYKRYRIILQETILFYKQILVLKTIKEKIVKQQYKLQLYSYPEIGKTIELVLRIYYFPGIKKVVKKVINSCNIYCRNKAARYLLYRKLQLLEVPASTWKSVFIDFIVSLPKSKKPITEKE